MTGYREHFYDQYTTVQQRHADLDDLRRRAQEERAIVVRDIVPHLPSDRSARILDLGCGYGGSTSVLNKSTRLDL
jgi:trans-aconitate methyltransferase